MKKIINNELLCEILQYLLMFIIILESNSIYAQIYGYHLIIRAVMVGMAILSLSFLMVLKKIKIHKSIIGFIIYDILCSIIMFINTDSISGKGVIALVFFMFLPLLQIYLSNLKKHEFKELLKKFVNIVIVLSLISLMFWIISAIFNILKPTNIVKIVWAKPYSSIESYFNLHFYTQDVWWITDSPLIRNTGIFTEGPMYALILMIALIFNNLLCFEKTKSNLLKTIILFITMLTTISVTGIISAVIILAFNIKEYMLSLSRVKQKFFLVSLVILIIIMIPLGTILAIKKMNTGSAIHRNMDIQIGLKNFLEKPILGHGVNHERSTESDYENGYGYSNSIIPVLTDGGITLTLIYIYPLVYLLIYSTVAKKYNWLCFGLIYSIILFTTLIQYRLSMMFMLAIMLNVKSVNFNINSQKFLLDK